MSQIYKSSTSSPPPPAVPTNFTMDDATTAIPAANNLNLLSRDTTDSNDNGIQTTADPNNGDNIYVELTNRLQGSGNTVGNVTDDIITFSLGATPGAYKFHFEVIGYDSSTPAAAGYAIEATAITTGAASSVVETPDADEDETDVLVEEADWEIVSSGNNIILRVTGVTGLTMNWNAVGYYVFIG